MSPDDIIDRCLASARGNLLGIIEVIEVWEDIMANSDSVEGGDEAISLLNRTPLPEVGSAEFRRAFASAMGSRTAGD